MISGWRPNWPGPEDPAPDEFRSVGEWAVEVAPQVEAGKWVGVSGGEGGGNACGGLRYCMALSRTVPTIMEYSLSADASRLRAARAMSRSL